MTDNSRWTNTRKIDWKVAEKQKKWNCILLKELRYCMLLERSGKTIISQTVYRIDKDYEKHFALVVAKKDNICEKKQSCWYETVFSSSPPWPGLPCICNNINGKISVRLHTLNKDWRIMNYEAIWWNMKSHDDVLKFHVKACICVIKHEVT